MNDPSTSGTVEPAKRITLDDLKHRAEVVRDLAALQTKQAVARVLGEDTTRALLVAAGVVVVVGSVAFFAGTRLGARRRTAS